MKPNDDITVPLCPVCHHNLHQTGELTFLRKAAPGKTLEIELKKLRRLYNKKAGLRVASL